jgi:hypothetical protein
MALEIRPVPASKSTRKAPGRHGLLRLLEKDTNLPMNASGIA